MTTIITAIGLVIFFEGLVYGGFPKMMKNMAFQVQIIPENILRIIGIIAMVIGLISIWLVH